ncbi:E3 ubiquitin-protein ligase TRIM21-like [Lepisosteus oculatus]|uniref:E3 ubiquitin-protein ligase TRIM21-like n=1 Tax=Lepisosteus oculatus TaxID=7918 RepID=UPI00371094CD
MVFALILVVAIGIASLSYFKTKGQQERIANAEQQIFDEKKRIAQLEKENKELHENKNISVRHAMAVTVTLDQDTINPFLRVSEDGRSVRWTEQRQNLTDTPERFDKEPYILGKRPEGIVWGYYWEVDVKNKKYWELGVAKDSVLRKGQLTLSPKSGFFVLSLWNGKTLEALTDHETLLNSVPIPKRVGVHVDYREMKVSFYNAVDHSHIYTFEEKIDKTVRPFFSPGNTEERALIIS